MAEQKKRYAYGIACIKFIDTVPHILMVKKRYTHAFADFVFGRYTNTHEDVVKLLNCTTYNEKIDIMSMDFDRMWMRISNQIPKNPSMNRFGNFRRVACNWRTQNSPWNIYMKCKLSFNRNFNHDDGKKLINMVKNSAVADPIWEIPKGRPTNGELPLNTAIREFKEETDASIDKYSIQFGIKPIVQSYMSNDTVYKVHYFIAMMHDCFEPSLNFSNIEQMSEVEDVRWMSLAAIEFINKGQKNKKRIQSLCKTVVHTARKKIHGIVKH